MPSRRIATILVSLLLATTTYAVDEVSPVDFCKDASLIGKEIMIARQSDRPIAETLPNALTRFRKLKDSYGLEKNEEEEKAVAELVMVAYDVPVFTGSRELQQRQISDFENKLFTECYRGFTSD